MPAPIALFVYNRPEHTRRAVESLLGNSLAAHSQLYIFSDGAKSSEVAPAVAEVRRYLRTISGFKAITISERAENAGLARSIVAGVTEVCEAHGRVIVMEDDLLVSPWFLDYMNQGLELYADDARVASIHGYCFAVPDRLPDTFFIRGADCWGWGTWSRAWRAFEPDGTKLLRALTERELLPAFDLGGAYPYSAMLRRQVAGKNDSWAIRWHASCFLASMLTLYPGRSLVRNIGNDGSGTHSEKTARFDSTVATTPIAVERISVEESVHALKSFARFLRERRGGAVRRTLHRVRSLFG